MKKPLLALLLIAAVATAADQSNPCEREECVTMTRAHYDKLIGTILILRNVILAMQQEQCT